MLKRCQNKVTAIDRKSIWYIPHHGVYHQKEPNEIRVVSTAQCSIKDIPSTAISCKDPTS